MKIAGYYPVVIEKMKEWAASSRALMIGSTIYKEEGKFYNRLLAVFPDGHYEYYDKHNCFKKGSFSPGRKAVGSELERTPFGYLISVTISVSQDWSRNEGRYDTAIYIANWPESRRDDWNRLLRERAIENQANVIAVNCAGTDLGGIIYAGDSYLLSPEGKIVGECEAYKDDILVVEL